MSRSSFTLLWAMGLSLALSAAAQESAPPPGPPVPVQPPPAQPPVAAPDANPPDLAALLKNAQAQDEMTRETAAKALLDGLALTLPKPVKPYLPKLRAELDSPQADVRAAALTSITRIIGSLAKNDRRYRQLTQDLASANAEKHLEAAKRLSAIIEDVREVEYIDGLIEELAAQDPQTVTAASAKLTALGADAASLLADALRDERPAVKRGAADILKALGPAAKDAASDLAFLLDDDDKLARKLAAQVLEGLGPDASDAANDLLLYLDNEDKTVRHVAASVLKKMGPAAESVAPDLADLLNNEDKGVRALAADVLLNLGPQAKSAVENLNSLLEDAASDADTRTRAANVLAAIGPEAKAAVPALEKLKADPDPETAKAVQGALDKIKGGQK